MAGHTPGPWEKFGLTIQKTVITNAPFRGCGDVTVVAECFVHKIRGMFADEAHANAELIAKAPEMYDELTTLRAELAKKDKEVERLQARVAELEAAQTPRPIEDAPRDEEFYALIRCSRDFDHGIGIEPCDGYFEGVVLEGWLPVPPAPTEAAE